LLWKAGCKIVITGRDKAKLETTAEQLQSQNIETLAVPGRYKQRSRCKKMIDATIAKFQRIDILINNAGISMRALFEDGTDVIRKVMDINFWGTVYATKYALPYITQTKGSIIGISSIAGYRGLPGRTGYSASKFAMQGFLEALRTELLPKNVHVLVACPGFTASTYRNTALAADGQVPGRIATR
jgi:dehydrogenase/reductase SDR family protein 7B